MARLIKGEKLNEEQREMVFAAFVHRGTVECPRSPSSFQRGGGPFSRPTDDEWIKSHSFWFTNDGKQLVNHNEVPNYPLPW
jgi:hypothetical protein